MRWIIAYDVSDNRARYRIARRLEQFGFRRQKSVFQGHGVPADIKALLAELAPLVNPETDVLSAWPSVDNGTVQATHAGRPLDQVHADWLIL